MKKLLIIACILVFVGCSKESINTSNIVGKWQAYKYVNKYGTQNILDLECTKDNYWELSPPNSFLNFLGTPCNPGDKPSWSGTYKISDDSLFINADKIALTYRIKEITNTEMVLFEVSFYKGAPIDTLTTFFKKQ